MITSSGCQPAVPAVCIRRTPGALPSMTLAPVPGMDHAVGGACSSAMARPFMGMGGDDVRALLPHSHCLWILLSNSRHLIAVLNCCIPKA